MTYGIIRGGRKVKTTGHVRGKFSILGKPMIWRLEVTEKWIWRFYFGTVSSFQAGD